MCHVSRKLPSRGTLEEMRLRTERAVLDAEHARAEAALAEGEVAALAKEIALLEVHFARNLSSPCRLLK